jgi:undecaprenyl-diphosphatase
MQRMEALGARRRGRDKFMDILTAITLGIIQGLTEFLPVSSSGHLVLFQKIFNITEPALLFDTMVHAGTLTAIAAALWKDIWEILKKLYQPLTLFLIIATIPTVIVALIFRHPLEELFNKGNFLGFSFLATSALLVMAEWQVIPAMQGFAKKLQTIAQLEKINDAKSTEANCKPARNMTWQDALFIGLMQALAIIPGISRSGATLSGALSRRLDRNFAARFSFLLSIPAILGALALQLKDILKIGSLAEGTDNSGIGLSAIIAGTLSAAIIGFFAVRLMLKIIKEKSLWGFAIYTGALGLLVLLDQYILHLVFK